MQLLRAVFASIPLLNGLGKRWETLEKRSSSVSGALMQVDFPSPCLVRPKDGGFYSFSTNNPTDPANVPFANSSDFITWNMVTHSDGTFVDALPNLPPWVGTSGGEWAPDVSQLDNGTFVMYFTAPTNFDNSSNHCIGAAYSDNVEGPYVPMADPFVCPTVKGSTIDPDGFRDIDGKRYVVYKIDYKTDNLTQFNSALPVGAYNPTASISAMKSKRTDASQLDKRKLNGNCPNENPPYNPTPITLQEVGADGWTKIGDPITLVDNDGAIDEGNTEGPTLMRSGIGHYVLFFSTGCFHQDSYTISYAVSTTGVRGPYTRASKPLFATGDFGLKAPGGADVSDDGLYMVLMSTIGDPSQPVTSGTRLLHSALLDNVDVLVFANGTLPSNSTPTTSSSASTPTSSTGSSGGSNGKGNDANTLHFGMPVPGNCVLALVVAAISMAVFG